MSRMIEQEDQSNWNWNKHRNLLPLCIRTSTTGQRKKLNWRRWICADGGVVTTSNRRQNSRHAGRWWEASCHIDVAANKYQRSHASRQRTGAQTRHGRLIVKEQVSKNTYYYHTLYDFGQNSKKGLIRLVVLCLQLQKKRERERKKQKNV